MNKEKWGKIREKGKSAWVWNSVARTIAILAGLILVYKISSGNWFSAGWLFYYVIIAICTPGIASFWWDHCEKKFGNK